LSKLLWLLFGVWVVVVVVVGCGGGGGGGGSKVIGPFSGSIPVGIHVSP